MFEEAQLYSPVTTDESGGVTVAQSIAEVAEVVDGFFADCSDDTITEMRSGVRTVAR